MVYSKTPTSRRAGIVTLSQLAGVDFTAVDDITESFNVSDEVYDPYVGATTVLPGISSFNEITLTTPWSEKAYVDIRAFAAKYKNSANNITMVMNIKGFVVTYSKCSLVSRTAAGFDLDTTDVNAKKLSITLKPGAELDPMKVR